MNPVLCTIGKYSALKLDPQLELMYVSCTLQ